MADEALGLFDGRNKPDFTTAWNFYQKALIFNNNINLDATVKSNENF